MAQRTTADVLETHRAGGHFLTVDGLKTFVYEKGEGDAVLCLHGVPTSSFLYRKVIDELAVRGLRGISFDLPGLGFSDRPEDFDYSWEGLARFATRVTEVLELDGYHLLVHDIGGPIGFALAEAQRPRVRSITALNTMIDVVNFQKPLPMRPFATPVLGEAELASISHLTWPLMFKGMCVADAESIPREEMNAYVDLLKRDDGGAAFLRIMRHFTQSEDFRERCYRAVRDVPYPIQVIWGVEDPGLTYERYGKEMERIADLTAMYRLPAKHFLQEEQAPAIGRLIAAFVGVGP